MCKLKYSDVIFGLCLQITNDLYQLTNLLNYKISSKQGSSFIAKLVPEGSFATNSKSLSTNSDIHLGEKRNKSSRRLLPVVLIFIVFIDH